MERRQRELLEFQDMRQLHLKFSENIADTVKIEKEIIPNISAVCREDIWSRALGAVSCGNLDDIRAMYGQSGSSELAADTKKWWEVIFSVALGAPPEELEKLAYDDSADPENINAEYIKMWAAQIASSAADREFKLREQKEIENQREMNRLEQEVKRYRENEATAKHKLKEYKELWSNRL